jgi:hypothetical protein
MGGGDTRLTGRAGLRLDGEGQSHNNMVRGLSEIPSVARICLFQTQLKSFFCVMALNI